MVDPKLRRCEADKEVHTLCIQAERSAARALAASLYLEPMMVAFSS